MKSAALILGKSYALRSSGLNMMTGFINGAGYQGIWAVKRAYWKKFIEHAKLDFLFRESEFNLVTFDSDGAVVIKWRSHAISMPQLERNKVVNGLNQFTPEFRELLAELCRLVCYGRDIQR